MNDQPPRTEDESSLAVTPRQRRSAVAWHVATAVLCGLLVTVSATVIAFRSARHSTRIRPNQMETHYNQRFLGSAIANYQAMHQSLPPSLEVLLDEPTPGISRREFVDGWGRPIEYDPDGRDMLKSLGRDGRPGGVGLDADIVPVESNLIYDLVEPPTYPQFILHCETGAMLPMCMFAGGATCFVVLWAGMPSYRIRERLVLKVAGLVATVLGATFMGAVLAILHQPTGH